MIIRDPLDLHKEQIFSSVEMPPNQWQTLHVLYANLATDFKAGVVAGFTLCTAMGEIHGTSGSNKC